MLLRIDEKDRAPLLIWKLNRNAFDFLKPQMYNFRWPASAPRYFPTVMRRTLLQSTLSHSEENVPVCYLSSGAAWSGKQNPSIWERLWHFIGIFQNVLECLTFLNQNITIKNEIEIELNGTVFHMFFVCGILKHNCLVMVALVKGLYLGSTIFQMHIFALVWWSWWQ